MSSLHRPAIVLGIVCLLSLSLIAQLTLRPSALEQRIQRIQDRILTPVVIEGQSDAPKLADRMAALHVPGVSIAVIHDGAIEWARGFGVTRIGGPPVTPETLFQAASIGKPVSALGVLRLVESGKLNLETDVNQYLKTWKVPENDFTSKAKVTLRGLLTHTAGMTVHGFPGYAPNAPIPTVAQILNGQPPANTPRIFVDTTPGTLWRYSGGGYVVAQLLLEDVTGTPFARLMRESVLTPIGMTHSTFEQPLPAARMTETATPYRSPGQPVPGGPHVYPEMAPAGLWTTPSDLARYAIEVQRALAGKSTVISAAMAREMLTPGMNGQGLGPQTGGSKGRPYFNHGGANEGYRCILVAYNNGDGAVIMTNGDNGGELADDVLRSIAYEYKWPDFQPVFRKIAKVDLKRIAEQKPDSRTEAVLRRLIDEVSRGEPDYSQMSPGFANAVRQQLPQTLTLMKQLGALQSISFRRVSPAGEDIYEAKFANGALEVRLQLAADGKVENGDFRLL